MIENKYALVFDMDGVITQTAKVHRAAWRKMFNRYLTDQSEKDRPMSDLDYKKYIDGKPRYEGVKSFLKSRNIELPFGNQSDEPGKETICGLGNEKNVLFKQLIKENGAELYPHAIEKIKSWREQGIKTAVVTSSKNSKLVLESAGIIDLFDVRVDGLTAQERNLKGKPNPDIFLEAAKELNTSPKKCIMFEDSVSGVQAGSNGNFALVVGINRGDNRKLLSENGADFVINDFEQFDVDDEEIQNYLKEPTPFLFPKYHEFKKHIQGKKPVIFLDYDGTLSPIVKHPEDAIISKEMKNVLKKCSKKNTVAVLSGRDLDDLKQKVGLETCIYAGSHGFRISGPDGLFKEHEKSEEILPKLDNIEEILKEEIPSIDKNARIDRKRYAVAVHFRNAKQENVPAIKMKIDQIVNDNPGFKIGSGKKILEIKPDIDWHKGKALLWILERLGLQDNTKNIPIYIGDDITDEDAFKTIHDFGVGILVGSHGQKTSAKYRLKNVYQVRILLEKLTNDL